MTAVPLEQVGRYSCPACKRRFDYLSEKKQHLRAEHADTKKER